MPLPIPRSVILSPSHIVNTAPAMSTTPMSIYTTAEGMDMPYIAVLMYPPLAKLTSMPTVCTTASSTVSTLVNIAILRLPSSPCFVHLSRGGMAIVSS